MEHVAFTGGGDTHVVSRQRRRTFAKPALSDLVQLFLVKLSLSDTSQRGVKRASGSWRRHLINIGILSMWRMGLYQVHQCCWL